MAYDYRTNVDGKPGVMFYIKQAPGANATSENCLYNKNSPFLLYFPKKIVSLQSKLLRQY